MITLPEYQQVQPPPSGETFATFEGSRWNESFFYYEITVSACVPTDRTVEMSDTDLLRAAEIAGTFEFLNEPGEDIYNDLARKPE